jgi:hypothetical protein
MNVKIENFIGIFEDAFTKDYCDAVIKYFEAAKLAGCSFTRQEEFNGIPKTIRDDTTVEMDLNHANQMMAHFADKFWQCFTQYTDVYDVLKSIEAPKNYMVRIQKTTVGQGYHVWHFESSAKQVAWRILTWTLYLNDIEEGGETEFLYFPKRIKPKTGTLVIWPAAFTHTHRGNPPLNDTKYITTGWVEF